jgi:hypothetical protein
MRQEALARDEEARAIRRAVRDAQRSAIADLPDPAEYARYLTGEEASALLGAWIAGAGCWRVAGEHAPMLRRLGLVEVGGCFLGAFGMAVLRELKAQQI